MIERLFVDVRRDGRMLQDRLDLGSEDEATALVIKVQGLDADAIAHEHELRGLESEALHTLAFLYWYRGDSLQAKAFAAPANPEWPAYEQVAAQGFNASQSPTLREGLPLKNEEHVCRSMARLLEIYSKAHPRA